LLADALLSNNKSDIARLRKANIAEESSQMSWIMGPAHAGTFSLLCNFEGWITQS